MTGPMYQDGKKQELYERVGRLESKLRDAEFETRQANHGITKLIDRMGWTTAEWNHKLNYAENAACEEIAKSLKLERELAGAKVALEDALHDAKRWRAIAGAPE